MFSDSGFNFKGWAVCCHSDKAHLAVHRPGAGVDVGTMIQQELGGLNGLCVAAAKERQAVERTWAYLSLGFCGSGVWGLSLGWLI